MQVNVYNEFDYLELDKKIGNDHERCFFISMKQLEVQREKVC